MISNTNGVCVSRQHYVKSRLRYSLVLRCIERNMSLMFRKLKESAESNELQGLPGSGNQNFRTDRLCWSPDVICFIVCTRSQYDTGLCYCTSACGCLLCNG